MQRIAELTDLPIEKVRLVLQLAYSRKGSLDKKDELAELRISQQKKLLDELVEYYDQRL